MNPTEIIFLRHGQTDENLKGAYHGRSSAPLNATGKEQIQKAAEIIQSEKPLLIFSSPLQRCRDCCEIICEANDFVEYCDELMEFDFGIFEGKGYQELLKLYPKEMQQWQNNWREFCIPQGEGVPQLIERVSNFLSRIIAENEGCRLLMVTHWGVIQAALAWLLHGGMEGFWRYELKNAGLTAISVHPQGNVLQYLNK